MSAPEVAPAKFCSGCGNPLAPATLSCPACHTLVHGEKLNQLASSARAEESMGQLSAALRTWREALQFLPPDTRQYEVVSGEVERLSRHIDARGSAPHRSSPGWLKKLGPVAPIAFLVWKFKAVIALALTKGKLLFFGLTKFSTFSSMLLSLGAYWALYGWWFGLGLVLSIYVHEMGHVYALRQFGIPATAPMFLPLIGAVVRMKQTVIGLRENARVGLAGPIWGTAGAIATFAAYAVWQSPVLGAIAHIAAWINLFNLIPVWQLDGARAFSALSRRQRAVLLGVTLLALAVTREGFLAILAAFFLFRLFTRDWPEEGDSKTLVQFTGLILVLAVLLTIPVPRITGR